MGFRGFLTVVLILSFLFCDAQKHGQLRIDSLVSELNRPHADTTRISLLGEIAFEYAYIDPNRGLNFADTALKLSEKANWAPGLGLSYAALGINYSAKSDIPKALESYFKALKINERLGNKSGVAGNLVNIGVQYLHHNDYPKGLSYFLKGLRIYEDLGDKVNAANTLSNIGNIYLEYKDYPKALRYYSDALKDYTALSNKRGIALTLGNIGIVHDAGGDYDKALENHYKALSINEAIGNKNSIQINLANIGYVYNHLKDYPKALEFQRRALTISEVIGAKSSIAVNLGNIGETYFAMAAAAGEKGETSRQKEDLQRAVLYLRQAIDLCKEIGYPAPAIEYGEYLSNAYSLLGNYKMAYESARDFTALKDSVFTVQKNIEMKTLENKREIELKDKDLEIKDKQLQINKLEISRKRNERLLLLLGIGLLAGLVLLSIRSLYRFHRSNRTLAREKSEVVDLLLEAQRLARIGNWNYDVLKNEIYWSEGTRLMYGVDENFPASYESFMALIHPEDRTEVANKIASGQQTGEVVEYVFRIVRPSGEIRVLNGQTRYVLDANGKPTRLYGIAQDITDLSQTEQTLRKSEANIRTIFDNTDTAYILLDRSLKVVSVNEPARNYASEVLHTAFTEGQPLTTSIVPQRRQFVEDQLHKVLEGETISYEVNEPYEDGTDRWFAARYLPVKHDRNTDGAIIILRDITARKMADQKSLELVDSLQKRNRDLSQFAYIVSHNLRAPIAKILGLAGLFSPDKEDHEDNGELIVRINEAAANLDDIISDLNTVITLRGTGNIAAEPVSFEAKVELICQVLDQQIREAGARISTDFQVTQINTIRSYLYSILYNFISNAIKYRSPDRPLEIHIATKEEAGMVHILIRDNGMGMDLEKYGSKLFGLYKRFHGAKAEGKGMGLYMVKTQVETLGGRISVDSEVGKGTVFNVYVPKG